MVLFLGSELMFFAGLFATYFTLRAQVPVWPPRGTVLDLAETTAFTAILVSSSLTIQSAVRRIERGDLRGMKRWMAASLILGIIFVGGQLYSYARTELEVASSSYASAFYAMTGFHGLHVVAGLIAMLVVLGRAAAGAYSEDQHDGVVATAYYWHFVDVVWIALFAAIYLLT